MLKTLQSISLYFTNVSVKYVKIRHKLNDACKLTESV